MMTSSFQNKQVQHRLRDAEPGNGPDQVSTNTSAEPIGMIERLKDEFGDYSSDPETSNWFWRDND